MNCHLLDCHAFHFDLNHETSPCNYLNSLYDLNSYIGSEGPQQLWYFDFSLISNLNSPIRFLLRSDPSGTYFINLWSLSELFHTDFNLYLKIFPTAFTNIIIVLSSDKVEIRFDFDSGLKDLRVPLILTKSLIQCHGYFNRMIIDLDCHNCNYIKFIKYR